MSAPVTEWTAADHTDLKARLEKAASDSLAAGEAPVIDYDTVRQAADALQAEVGEVVDWLRSGLHDFPSAYADEIADAIERKDYITRTALGLGK